MATSKAVPVGLADLHVQLKIMNKLLASQLRDKLSQQDLVGVLASTGASDKEIADILGTTSATVSVTKQRLKRKAAGRTEVSE